MDRATTVTDYDGQWQFEFASTTPVGINGVRCIDGTGLVTVENGRVVGTTFSEFEGISSSQGALEGRIIEGQDGTFFTVARSQGGRNAFTAIIDKDLPGMSGTWEDIHACKGTFAASRV